MAAEASEGVRLAAISGPDVEVIEQAIEGLPLQAARLTPRGGTVGLVCLRLGSLSVAVGSVDFPLATFGEVRSDMVTIGIPLTSGEGTWNGTPIDPQRMWTHGPGTEHEGLGVHPPIFAALSLPLAETGAVGCRQRVSVRTGVEVADLGALLRRAAAAVRAGTVTAQSTPLLEHDLREALDDALSGPSPEEPRSTASALLVRSCVEVADQVGPSPRVATLADALGVTDRWIRAAFRKECGVSPSAFFRARNLHRARRDLHRADRFDISVTDVAMRWGFRHLGRFSGLYREFFGELPRETLQRPPGPN
jgi:AraC-like DNA-binding protein